MTPHQPQTLSAYLRAARLEAGLSIRQLARLSGVSHSYLVKLETDQKENPGADKLLRLAEVLEIDPSALLRFIGVEPPSTLPPPRVYFRRKFGMSEAEAARLSRLVEQHMNQPTNEGDTPT